MVLSLGCGLPGRENNGFWAAVGMFFLRYGGDDNKKL